MISPVLLQKEHQDIPDSFGMKIWYVTGKVDEFELAERIFQKDIQMLELITKDNIVNYVPFSSIQRIEFDKNFTKIIEIKRKLEHERREKEDALHP
jgi:hypothetical protein